MDGKPCEGDDYITVHEEQHHFFALLTTQDANEIKWHEYGISFGDASCNMDFPSLGCVINLVFEVSIIPM